MAAGAGSRASEPLCPGGSLSFHPAPVIFPALAIGPVINVAGECHKRTEPASSVPEPLASSRPLVAHPCSWIVSSLHAQMFRGPVSGPLFSPLRGQLLPPLHHHPCRSSPIFTNFGGVQPSRGPCASSSSPAACSRCLSLCFLGVCGAGRGLSARGAGVNGAGHPGL